MMAGVCNRSIPQPRSTGHYQLFIGGAVFDPYKETWIEGEGFAAETPRGAPLYTRRAYVRIEVPIPNGQGTVFKRTIVWCGFHDSFDSCPARWKDRRTGTWIYGHVSLFRGYQCFWFIPDKEQPTPRR